MKTNKSAIIVNPVSGIGKNAHKRKESLQKIIKESGWKGMTLETTKKVSAQMLARKAVKNGAARIIVSGGDGTVMQVVGELVNKNVILGVIPSGTANIFAKNLGIPMDTQAALDIALNGVSRKIDVGRANNHFFGFIAGIGMDAEIMKDTSRDLKDRIGQLAYITTWMQNLKNKPRLYSVSINGGAKKEYKASAILIGNMEKSMAGVKAFPGASPRSGILQISIVNVNSFKDWLNFVYNGFKGTMEKSSCITMLHGKNIEIKSLDEKIHFQCDGDVFEPTKKLTVTIIPSGLSVAFPK